MKKIKLIIKLINIKKLRENLFCMLVIKLEKYIKIISNPLIIIKNNKIEQIGFDCQKNIKIQIEKVLRRIIIIMKIGWGWEFMRIYKINNNKIK